IPARGMIRVARFDWATDAHHLGTHLGIATRCTICCQARPLFCGHGAQAFCNMRSPTVSNYSFPTTSNILLRASDREVFSEDQLTGQCGSVWGNRDVLCTRSTRRGYIRELLPTAGLKHKWWRGVPAATLSKSAKLAAVR